MSENENLLDMDDERKYNQINYILEYKIRIRNLYCALLPLPILMRPAARLLLNKIFLSVGFFRLMCDVTDCVNGPVNKINVIRNQVAQLLFLFFCNKL